MRSGLGGWGGGSYLEAIKLNKENNTSPLVTLGNCFTGINRVFCGIFFFLLPIFRIEYLACYFSPQSAFFIIIVSKENPERTPLHYFAA